MGEIYWFTYVLVVLLRKAGAPPMNSVSIATLSDVIPTPVSLELGGSKRTSDLL